MTNFCPRCGKLYDGNLPHCPYCMQVNQSNISSPSGRRDQPPRKRRSNKGAIVLIIIIVLVGTAGRMFLQFNASKIQNKISSFVQETLDVDLPDTNLIQENKDIPVCSSMSELVTCVEKSLLAKEDKLTVHLSNGLTTSDILNINQYVNPCWGSCTQYRENVKILSNDITELELTLKHSDEVYVYDAICNGGDISLAPKTAQKLHKKVQKIRKTEIKPSMSDYKKELAFYKYLLDTCIYNHHHVKNCQCSTKKGEIEVPTDPSHTAYGALIDGNPVCSGYARALHLLLTCEGINAKIIAGHGEGQDHCWNLVELDGKWYQLDATWDDNDIAKKSSYYYFNITDDMMYGSHVWDKEMYPAATGKKYNYYRLKKRYFTSKKKFKKAMVKAIVKKREKTYVALLDGFRIKDKDMEILFKENNGLSSVRWNIIEDSDYIVIKVIAR